MDSLRVLLVGASGKMGREVIVAAMKAREAGADVSVVGGLVSRQSKLLGQKIDGVEHALSDGWEENFSSANVIIDFSSEGGTALSLQIAKEKNIPALICTTALSDSVKKAMHEVGKQVPLVFASNTSVAVNTIIKLVGEAAKMLGPSFDVEICDIHHKLKKDSPSGTAISLGESVAKVRGQNLQEVAVYGRSGDDLKRVAGEIGFSAVRGGDAPGEHTVFFIGDGERIEIGNRVLRRSVFADGALRAARWLVLKAKKKEAGFYSMLDVLGGE